VAAIELVAEPIVLAVATFPAVVGAIAMLLVEALEAVPVDITEPARGPAVAAAPLAWALVAVAVAVAVDAGVSPALHRKDDEDSDMRSLFRSAVKLVKFALLVTAYPLLSTSAQQAVPQSAAGAPAPATVPISFDTPQLAADALVDAAEKFDVAALIAIFGPGGDDIVLTGELPQDRQRALDFAAQAKEKKTGSVDPKTGNRAFLLVGDEDWPFPVPIVKTAGKWLFDAPAGRKELLYRRIGSNELDAIDICHGYVEAQYDFAFRKRDEYDVNQYAQRIVSTPGQQDGLAWQEPDGTWAGPVGEKIARAIEEGYSTKAEPYHGYYFKILKGQGPAAPLGEMDYVVKGIMIGGFALVAAPAEYAVTGVKTFIVSQDGVVYERDFGPGTLDAFAKMELFNPDKSWTPVPQEDD